MLVFSILFLEKQLHTELRLLDNDALTLNRTVVIPSPEMHSLEVLGKLFSYDYFPEKFNYDLFEMDQILRQHKADLRCSSLHHIEFSKNLYF